MWLLTLFPKLRDRFLGVYFVIYLFQIFHGAKHRKTKNTPRLRIRMEIVGLREILKGLPQFWARSTFPGALG